MDAKFVAELVTQVAFPIVLLLFAVYWIGKYGLPKLADTIKGITDDFREEMRLEREFHSTNINRFFETQHREHEEISADIKEVGGRVIEVVKERCSSIAGCDDDSAGKKKLKT